MNCIGHLDYWSEFYQFPGWVGHHTNIQPLVDFQVIRKNPHFLLAVALVGVRDDHLDIHTVKWI